jgi:hypothetical protein
MPTVPPPSRNDATTEIIVVPHISGLPAAAASAVDRRDELVLAAAEVRAITNPDTAAQAASILSQLAEFSRSIEDSRKTAVTPALTLQRKVNDLAKELTIAVEAERSRISRLLGDYQMEIRRIQQEQERKAREEEERIRAEAQAKADALLASGRNVETKLEKLEVKTFNAVAEVRAAGAVPVAPKLAGVATRTEVKFEITDIAALYRARPELVTLTPNTAAIKAVLKAAPSLELPGLRHWKEASTFVR